jgi:hypothetical protein
MMINLRPSLAQHLQQRLRAFEDGFRHNVALVGLPGSGKTFQVQQLIATDHTSLVIYCPLYRESCRTFLQRFLGAILQAGLRAPGGQPLERLLQRADAELPALATAVHSIEHLVARRALSEAFNRSLDAVPLVSAAHGRPCVLILDEFLFLEELGLSHAFHELGKRVMTWPTTWFILTSSSPFRAKAILRERLQLLFGQFELLTLEALEPARATAWVQQELKGLKGVKVVTPFLLNWLGASPWYLTVFLKRLKELANLRQASELTEALFLQTAWDLIGSPEGTLHQWCSSRIEPLSHLRDGGRAREAVLQIADGARTMTAVAGRIGRSRLDAALQVLADHDIAQRNGTCWVVLDPVLRCWLSTVLPSWQSEAGTDRAMVRQRFDEYLRSLWRHWSQTQQRSLSEQVADLLAHFSDETVSLDQKTGRLPRFQAVQALSASPGSAYLVAEGRGKRWCCSVSEIPVTEQGIASFEAFCRQQTPKPSRKVVVAKAGLDENATLIAKAANMWVWGAGELGVLMELYSPHA